MQIWQPSDAHRLRQMRLAQGLDTFALATRCTLSERQLLELEGTGEGSFYSETIKFQTGIKVLRLLGDETAAQSVQATALPPVASGKALQSVNLPLQVAPPSENQRLLRHIGMALALSGALVSLVNILDGLGPRPGGVLLVVVGLAIVALALLGRNWWAVVVLCWGCLLINFSSALAIRGLENVSWVAVPIAVMAAGWFMGRGMAWTIAAVSGLGALGLYLMHRQGYAFAKAMPIESVLAGLLVACAVAALVGGAISQTYGRQIELISESRAELNAVMDSTRAMIWSVSAHDFRLRTFNRVLEREVHTLLGVQPGQGMLPAQVFGAEKGQDWDALYRKAVDGDGLAIEKEIFGDERLFEVSFQPIHKANQVIGIAVYAQEIGKQNQSERMVA